MCSMERDGTRDETAVPCLREGCGGQENNSLLRGANKVVRHLELAHTHHCRHRPAPNTLSTCTTALVLSNDGTSKRRNGSFSGLDSLGRFCRFHIFNQSSKIP